MFMSSQPTFIDAHGACLESAFDSFDFDGLNANFTSDEYGMLGYLANSKDDFLATHMQPRLIFDLPSSVSTPSSGSEICTPPFTNLVIDQLDFSPLEKDQSFMSSPSPQPTLGSLSPLTNSNASSPMHFDQTDFPSDSLGGNALGLLDDGYLLNGLEGPLQNYSSSLPASGVSVATAQQLLPPPDDSVLSPLVVATAQLSIENELRVSSVEQHTHLQTVNPSATYEVNTRLNESSNPSALGASIPAAAAEDSHSAPSPTQKQKKSVKRLSPGSVRNARARRVRQVRAAAAKHKSYRELSASPAPEPESPSPDIIIPITNTTPYRAVDECEYGFREWYRDDRGTRVGKWKCGKCHQVIGRRPDLHRHFKKCVMKEKYYCVDVIHADGTVWRGCGMVFSRRDACHRHLKKRLIDGRCIKRKPKVDQIRCVDEFAMKMHVYEDGIDNYEWRAALPATEKNRLARTALSQIKKNMF